MTDGPDRMAALSPAKRALLLRRLHRDAQRVGVPALPRSDGEQRFAASDGQERLWFLHELDQESVAYVLPIVLRLRGPLDVPALTASLAWLTDRHEVLRTGFGTGADGVVEQVVHPAGVAVPGVPVIDVTESELAAAVRERVAQPFDLRTPPLLQASVLRVAEDHHVLVLCVHHIVVDGWSLSILVAELEAAYAAFTAGTAPGLAAPTLHYADFAEWERSTAGSREADLDYWRERLAGVSAMDLPVDRQIAGARSWRGDAVPVTVPPELVTRLERVAEDHDCTLFMVLAAGLAVVLGRWSEQDDVVIGTPVAGRERVELEDMVGLFVNTVPLRLTLGQQWSVTDLLAHARDVCTGAYAHAGTPFSRIVQTAGRHGDGGLVRVMLALRNVGLRDPELAGLRCEVVEVPSGGAQLDLGLELVPRTDGGLGGWLEFATDLFDRAHVERIVTALDCVLTSLVADPGRPVGELPMSDDASRHRVITDFSGATVSATVPSVVPRWFESIVDLMGDAVAVIDDHTGDTLTYRDLDGRANRLAHHLRALGVRAEDAVGVCLDRGVDLVVSVLAVFKAGAVYVPLDPGHPPARLSRMARDAAPVLVLTTGAHAGAVATGARQIRLDTDGAALAGRPDARLDDAPQAAAAAYVLFTSGSTGRPKGVVGTHIGLANRLADMVVALGIAPDERVLQKTPIGFDPSLTEMLAPLVAGARLVVAEPGRHGDPDYLLDALTRHGITSIDFVPSMLRPLLDRVPAGTALASLRRVFSGGEELSAELAERVLAAAPGVALINLYGPTEATVDVTAHLVTAPVPDRVPIGRPLPGVGLYVLDAAYRPVPVGVPGQLFIGGPQLARGYLDAPGLTAERFVPHPMEPGARLYATGDRVSWLPDGSLRYLGRYDTQVKIRGVRVEPGETEAVLRTHATVGDAAVVVRGTGDAAGLVGYLVRAEPGEEATGEQLRGHVRAALPPAMVPSRFVWLDAFPVTSAGKVDRGALPDPGEAERDACTPPADDLEAVVAGLWAELLGVERVGALDDFYQLGGHSLLATQLVARAGDLFRLTLPLSGFVDAATVRDFAGRLRKAGAEAGSDADRIAGIVLAVSAMSADEVTAGLDTTTNGEE